MPKLGTHKLAHVASEIKHLGQQMIKYLGHAILSHDKILGRDLFDQPIRNGSTCIHTSFRYTLINQNGGSTYKNPSK